MNESHHVDINCIKAYICDAKAGERGVEQKIIKMLFTNVCINTGYNKIIGLGEYTNEYGVEKKTWFDSLAGSKR